MCTVWWRPWLLKCDRDRVYSWRRPCKFLELDAVQSFTSCKLRSFWNKSCCRCSDNPVFFLACKLPILKNIRTRNKHLWLRAVPVMKPDMEDQGADYGALCGIGTVANSISCWFAGMSFFLSLYMFFLALWIFMQGCGMVFCTFLALEPCSTWPRLMAFTQGAEAGEAEAFVS